MSRRPVATGLLLSSFLLALAACSGPEARVSRYVERSHKYFADQKYDKARVEVSNALQIDPNNAAARVLAGQIAEKQAKPRDAVGNYNAALEADPDNIEARAALGRLYLLGGLPDKAKEIIEPALAKAPNNAQLLTVRGGLKAVQGDKDGALADAEAAVQAAPDDEVAIALLAAQYLSHDRNDDAIAALQKGIGLKPDSIDLRVILADLLMRAGNTAGAEEQLKTIADRNRTALASWQQLARFYLLQKNPDAAVQALRDAVKYNPDNIQAKDALVTLVANQKGADAAQAQMLEFVKADPRDTQLKNSLGQFYEAARKPDQAEATYREVMAADGLKAQGLVARNRLAAMLVRKGDIAGAEQLIKEVLTENPRDNDALVLRAGIALSRNDTAAAITDLRAVLRDQPNSQPLMRALARAHLQDHNPTLAEEVLRNAVQANPADIESRGELAALLAQTGRPALAQPILEQLGRDAPDNIPVREALFRVQGAQSDWAGAERTAEEVKRLRPDLPSGYLLSGALRERDKKYAEAVGQYELAMGHARDAMEVLPTVVRADLLQKQPQKAVSRLTAYLQKAPDSAQAHEMLGEVRLSQGEYAAAVESFDKAVSIDPKRWPSWRGKTLAQDGLKQPDQALATLQAGVAASGAGELALDLAMRQEKLGHHDAAIQVYEDLLKRAPDSLPVANNLAMLLANSRSDAASLQRADELGKLLESSDEPSYLDTRGWIKFRRGELDQALPLLKQAATKAPRSQEILYHLGMAQYRSGDRNAARQSLEAALGANQGFVGADEARATLAELHGTG